MLYRRQKVELDNEEAYFKMWRWNTLIKGELKEWHIVDRIKHLITSGVYE